MSYIGRDDQDEEDLLVEILNQLKLLNVRFEEAFDTQISDGDENNG